MHITDDYPQALLEEINNTAKVISKNAQDTQEALLTVETFILSE